jgi:hypothetical protein
MIQFFFQLPGSVPWMYFKYISSKLFGCYFAECKGWVIVKALGGIFQPAFSLIEELQFQIGKVLLEPILEITDPQIGTYRQIHIAAFCWMKN